MVRIVLKDWILWFFFMISVERDIFVYFFPSCCILKIDEGFSMGCIINFKVLSNLGQKINNKNSITSSQS